MKTNTEEAFCMKSKSHVVIQKYQDLCMKTIRKTIHLVKSIIERCAKHMAGVGNTGLRRNSSNKKIQSYSYVNLISHL